jgi:cytoskeleton protein RodZ
MGTVASELKSEREKRKISLSQIAAETRISLRHLESLEEGRFGDLPGGIYNRAFLRAYCETLNLDPHDIMQRYDAEVTPIAERPPRSKAHIPQKRSSLRISPFIVWGIMLLISVAGVFFSRKWITAIFSPYFSHTPPTNARYEPEQPQGNPKAASTPASPTASPAQPSGTLETNEPAKASPPPAAVQEVSVPAPSPSEPAVDAKAIRLEVSAREKCWISIHRDGNPVFQKTMQPGEIQSFRAAEKFLIIVGNAGGIQLKINGKPARPLGKPGEVIKIQIDEKNLQDFLDQTAG